MIRAVCRREGHRWTLGVQGHAGAAPHGADLVCAAVTGLVCALAGYVQKLWQQGALETPPVLRLESGDAEITAQAQLLAEPFSLVLTGLELLQQEYPDNVTVER